MFQFVAGKGLFWQLILGQSAHIFAPVFSQFASRPLHTDWSVHYPCIKYLFKRRHLKTRLFLSTVYFVTDKKCSALQPFCFLLIRGVLSLERTIFFKVVNKSCQTHASYVYVCVCVCWIHVEDVSELALPQTEDQVSTEFRQCLPLWS